MAIVEKVLLRQGIYEAPQGTFVGSPRMLRHLVKQFDGMRREGIQIPIAWGHIPDALPGDADDRARKQFYLSKHNAGYLLGLNYDPESGRLKFRGDIPGAEIDEQGRLLTECVLPDGRKVKSAIGEVSAAIKDWKDGKGKVWKKSLVHVALVPLPVFAGQDGFRALSTALFDTPANNQFAGWTLSLADFHTELATSSEGKNMADEPLDLDNDTDDEEVKGGETPPTPPEAPKPAEGGAVPPGYAATIAGLQGLGVHLPPHTTPENFFQHAEIAFHALENAPSPDEDENEPNDLDNEGEPGGGQVVEEQRPVMMSLTTETDPVRLKFLSKRQDEHKAGLLRRIDKLAKSKLIPEADADALREKVGGYQLSLTAELDLVPRSVDRTLDIWEKAARHFKPQVVAKKVLLGTIGKEAPRPAVDEGFTEKELEERAAKVSHKQ